uniref:Uncharacterized protein n=1 Tax=Gallus gallus TaxID=9031 RepID=A0A8V0ZSK2_CHICK
LFLTSFLHTRVPGAQGLGQHHGKVCITSACLSCIHAPNQETQNHTALTIPLMLSGAAIHRTGGSFFPPWRGQRLQPLEASQFCQPPFLLCWAG